MSHATDSYDDPFSEEEYRGSIATLKNNKAARIDDVLVEQLKNIGPKTPKHLLSNRRFYVKLNKERSRWRKQKNGLPQGSVLASTLFNIYTNDQPIHYRPSSLIYADDLCITAQYQSFKQIKKTIEEALDNPTTYYKVNSLHANVEKKSLRSISGIEAKRPREYYPSEIPWCNIR